MSVENHNVLYIIAKKMFKIVHKNRRRLTFYIHKSRHKYIFNKI